VTRLVATTRPLGHRPDLLGFAGEDGALWWTTHGGLAGRGVAATIELPGGLDEPGGTARVAAALGALDVDDPIRRPGTGPVALGALPFDRAVPATLTIPEVLVGADTEGAWITTVRPAGSPPVEEATAAGDPELGAPPAGRSPDRFTLTPSMPHDAWREVVAEAVEHIRAGDLAKVVLARSIAVTANRPFVTAEVLQRLIALYPSCMVFRVGSFLGASPELLISRRDGEVRSHPLAGTVAHSGAGAADRAEVERLLGSVKDRSEHAFVVSELRAALEPYCSTLQVPDTPAILELRNVSHLATPIRGTLRADRPGGPAGALELVDAVHPTPAVAGTPTDKATAYLQTVEGFERGPYAGPVGWVDGRGDGDWAIGIRSALVEGAAARIFAGAGIVADSDPAAELAETQLKLQALLAALVRP
jgi:menaquinone-specific isochorismate synthase